MEIIDKELSRQGIEGELGEPVLKLREAVQAMVVRKLTEMRDRSLSRCE